MEDNGLGHQCHLVVTVGAAITEETTPNVYLEYNPESNYARIPAYGISFLKFGYQCITSKMVLVSHNGVGEFYVTYLLTK